MIGTTCRPCYHALEGTAGVARLLRPTHLQEISSSERDALTPFIVLVSAALEDGHAVTLDSTPVVTAETSLHMHGALPQHHQGGTSVEENPPSPPAPPPPSPPPLLCLQVATPGMSSEARREQACQLRALMAAEPGVREAVAGHILARERWGTSGSDGQYASECSYEEEEVDVLGPATARTITTPPPGLDVVVALLTVRNHQADRKGGHFQWPVCFVAYCGNWDEADCQIQSRPLFGMLMPTRLKTCPALSRRPPHPLSTDPRANPWRVGGSGSDLQDCPFASGPHGVSYFSTPSSFVGPGCIKWSAHRNRGHPHSFSDQRDHHPNGKG